MKYKQPKVKEWELCLEKQVFKLIW
jgi:hypothetical protein